MNSSNENQPVFNAGQLFNGVQPTPPQQPAKPQQPAATQQSASISSRVSTTQAPNSTGSDRPITFWGILDAFRRRWIPALAVGIPAALLVAGLLWQMIPAQFETSALLKIQQYQQVLGVDTKEREAEFLTYRDSQINFLKSRPVLTSAMRVEGVKETRMMRDIKYPVEFLEQELIVDFDYSAEFIRISLEGEYPEDIATVVNAVKDVYLDEVVYNERNQKINGLRTLEGKFNDLDQNVRKNQDRIARLADELGTGDSKVAILGQQRIQDTLRGLDMSLRELNDAIREEEAKRQYFKERGYSEEQIRAALPMLSYGGPRNPAVAAPAVDPNAAAQKQLADLRSKIIQFQRNIRDKRHPSLLAMQQREKELSASLTGVAPVPDGSPGVAISNYDYLLKQRDKLEVEIKNTNESLDLMGARVVQLEREKEDIAYLVKTRDGLAQEIANRRIELDAPQRVSVVQDANVPEKRNVKKRTQMATFGGIAVFGMVLAGFTMFEWFSHRVGSTSDIANAVNLRLVGTIPSPDKGGLLGLGIFAGKVNFDEWNRAVIESMDVVRTYLMRHIDPSRSASILITSASANEGKTTVSCQLAASLARSGKRVALVDCDFRRPSAHLMMDGQEGPGICEYLRGEIALKDIYQNTQANGLTFIGAGQVDQDVLQKLSADGGRAMIATLKSQFDFVIIDTSPLLFVAEPSMLAQNADIVLLSTRKDYSRINYVAQSRDSLRSLQVPLLGAIMVGSDSDFQRQSCGYRQEVQRSAGREQLVRS